MYNIVAELHTGQYGVEINLRVMHLERKMRFNEEQET